MMKPTDVSGFCYNIPISQQERYQLMTNNLTLGEARQIIDEAITNYTDSVPQKTAETIAYAVNHDLQLRDYIMGLPNIHGLAKVHDFVMVLTAGVPEEERYSLYTITALFNYELGLIDMSRELSNKVADINPNYNLNKLLKRIFQANWEPSMMSQMRNELHKVVTQTLIDYADMPISEVAY